MCDRLGMAPAPAGRTDPWWQRRGPSILVFCGVLGTMALASLLLWDRVTDLVPDAGADEEGVDPWEDPVGIEQVGDFQVVRIPDCAAAPVVRIELWDRESQAYWQVEGPPTPMDSFVVGVTPEGFTETTAYEAPPDGAVLRLVVVRKVKGVAGLRYTEEDVREGVVASGTPLVRYETEDFVTGSVCADEEDEDGDGTDDEVLDGTTTEDPDEGT